MLFYTRAGVLPAFRMWFRWISGCKVANTASVCSVYCKALYWRATIYNHSPTFKFEGSGCEALTNVIPDVSVAFCGQHQQTPYSQCICAILATSSKSGADELNTYRARGSSKEEGALPVNPRKEQQNICRNITTLHRQIVLPSTHVICHFAS